MSHLLSPERNSKLWGSKDLHAAKDAYFQSLGLPGGMVEDHVSSKLSDEMLQHCFVGGTLVDQVGREVPRLHQAYEIVVPAEIH